jgi:hypothetical protein
MTSAAIQQFFASDATSSSKSDAVGADSDPVLRTALSITLVLFLLYGPEEWYVRAFTAVAAISGLVWRKLLTNSWLWLVVASLQGAAVYVERFSADNHQYLMFYWAVAVTLALWNDDPLRCLRINARLLIGLAFLFATGWKLTASFRSGSFLEFALLSDPRFSGFTAWITGTASEALEKNREGISMLMNDLRGSLVLQGAESVRPLALAMAWFTIAIEAWVALAFLVPTAWRLSRTRDLALNTFLLTIYAVATVPGFAYILIAMGLMQSQRKPQWIRWTYFGSLLATQLYTMPWGRIMERISKVTG